MAFNQIDVFLFLLIWYSNKSSGCHEGWEGFVDDEGNVECFPCRKCPEGKTAVENCTKDHDTICDECTGDEYYHSKNMQCKTCTVCDAGYYVKMNCSRFNDTACDVCPTGTFSLVQNSSICSNCDVCNGTQVMFRNCNNTVDTICGECTDDEYYHSKNMQCKTCTVCDAGYYVRSNCSTFKDTECNVCPNGTFSLVQSSSTCKNCTDCRETNIIQACNRTADRVCEQTGQENGKLQLVQRVFLVVGIIIFVVLLILCVRHAWRHRRNDGNGDPQEMQTLQGNSSCGAIEVNPNKKQTDKRYQRSETSEFTFEPDKELSVTDKEQRIKSSVSAPGEMHVRRHNMKVKHVRDIKVRSKSGKEPCWISGMCVLDQNKVVLCDFWNKYVKLVDTKRNKIVSQIRLPSKPWDTALEPRDVTAESTTRNLIVTQPDASCLRHIRVTNDQITDTNKFIPVEGLCRGIQVIQDKKLAVSYFRPGKVEILDMDGQVLERLETDHDGARLFREPNYLAVSPDSRTLYVSDYWNDTLTSISTRDLSVMTKLEGLDNPHGVTVDRTGSVFVCCDDRTIHLVDATDWTTQILVWKDGLCESPQAIGLSPEGDRMYVSGNGSDHVQEFQLTEN